MREHNNGKGDDNRHESARNLIMAMGKHEARELVIGLLESHTDNRAKMAQLQYELSHFCPDAEQDINKWLPPRVATRLGCGACGGHLSGVTAEDAAECSDASNQVRSDAYGEILKEYRAVEAKVRRLEKYVSLLKEPNSTILRRHYLEDIPLKVVGAEMHIKERSLQRYRDSAVDDLAGMYVYLSELRRRACNT